MDQHPRHRHIADLEIVFDAEELDSWITAITDAAEESNMLPYPDDVNIEAPSVDDAANALLTFLMVCHGPDPDDVDFLSLISQHCADGTKFEAPFHISLLFRPDRLFVKL